MRVGIITFHCSYNFGSALQAYALQTTIRALGHDVYIIDYRSRDFDNYKVLSVQHPRNTVRSLLNLRQMLARRNSFHRFWNDYLNLTKAKFTYKNESALEGLCDEFDCFVCGSDQIWNLDCTKGVVAPFFLAFAGDKRRVAYAPSLGHKSFEQRYFDRNMVSELLRRFDALSVREREGAEMLQPLVDRRIEVAVDPTLLLTSEAYRPLCTSVWDFDYVFVYLLRQCDELVEYARRVAESGRKVVCVSQRDLGIPNAIQLFGVGPDEFVSLVSHASLVLSNSFHATAFSILFERPFLSFATDESSSRITGLLDMVGLGDCAVTVSGGITLPQVDWAAVKGNLDAVIEPSRRFLVNSLE